MGSRPGVEGVDVLTATRDTLGGAFSPATVLYDANAPYTEPWLDDSCQYLYLSSGSTSQVIRLTLN